MSLLERWMEDTVVSQKDGFPSLPSLVVYARAFVSSSGAVESARRKEGHTKARRWCDGKMDGIFQFTYDIVTFPAPSFSSGR